MDSYKTRIYVNAKGFKNVNPGKDKEGKEIKPQFEDFVLLFNDNVLRVESPTSGHLSTEPQRKTVDALITKWFNDHRFGTPESKNDIDVATSVVGNEAMSVQVLTLTAPTDGVMNEDKVKAAARKVDAWLKATGVPAEKPAAESKPAAAAAATAAAAKPADDGAAKPADDGAAKPADDGAAKPADDGAAKPAAPAKEESAPAKPADDGAAKPAAPAKEESAPAKPAATISGWDFSKSVDENLDRYGV